MKSAGLLVLFVAAMTAAGAPPARRAVEPRDFFVYGCVREFARAHAFPLYDSSTGYARDAHRRGRVFRRSITGKSTFAASGP